MDNQDRIKLFADACKESLEVAKDNKVGGLGIGRFGALQIGRKHPKWAYDTKRKNAVFNTAF